MQTCRMFAGICSVCTIGITIKPFLTFSKLEPAHVHAPDPCYYRPQRSWAKVISLQASVCPHGEGSAQNFGGGVCSKFSGGGRSDPNFGGGVWNFFFFFFSIYFPPKKISSGMHTLPPSAPETVNARPVRILLECILVQIMMVEKSAFLCIGIPRVKTSRIWVKTKWKEQLPSEIISTLLNWRFTGRLDRRCFR